MIEYMSYVKGTAMLQRLVDRLHWLRIRRAARKGAERGEGYAAHGWSLHEQDLAAITQQARPWLERQIANAGIPYGFSLYGTSLGLAKVVDDKRVRLWYEDQPNFRRVDRDQAMDAIQARILTLPLSVYPDATRVEVLFMSFSDVMLQAAEEAGIE